MRGRGGKEVREGGESEREANGAVADGRAETAVPIPLSPLLETQMTS